MTRARRLALVVVLAGLVLAWVLYRRGAPRGVVIAAALPLTPP